LHLPPVHPLVAGKASQTFEPVKQLALTKKARLVFWVETRKGIAVLMAALTR